MFTSSSWEKYSSQTSLQSFQSSSTLTSSFTTPPTTTTASKSQSFNTSSSSLPIAIQIVHDNEYILSQHEQNSTNEKVLNHHHPSLSVTTSPYFHLHHHLIDPPPKPRVPQRLSPNPSIHLSIPHSFKKPPPPPPPTPTLSIPSKYVNTMPVTCSTLKPPIFTKIPVITSTTKTSTTIISSFNNEDFQSTHNLSDECKDVLS